MGKLGMSERKMKALTAKMETVSDTDWKRYKKSDMLFVLSV